MIPPEQSMSGSNRTIIESMIIAEDDDDWVGDLTAADEDDGFIWLYIEGTGDGGDLLPISGDSPPVGDELIDESGDKLFNIVVVVVGCCWVTIELADMATHA